MVLLRKASLAVPAIVALFAFAHSFRCSLWARSQHHPRRAHGGPFRPGGHAWGRAGGRAGARHAGALQPSLLPARSGTATVAPHPVVLLNQHAFQVLLRNNALYLVAASEMDAEEWCAGVPMIMAAQRGARFWINMPSSAGTAGW